MAATMPSNAHLLHELVAVHMLSRAPDLQPPVGIGTASQSSPSVRTSPMLLFVASNSHVLGMVTDMQLAGWCYRRNTLGRWVFSVAGPTV